MPGLEIHGLALDLVPEPGGGLPGLAEDPLDVPEHRNELGLELGVDGGLGVLEGRVDVFEGGLQLCVMGHDISIPMSPGWGDIRLPRGRVPAGMGDFGQDLALGQTGELQVLSALRRHRHTHHVDDVRDDPDWQTRGVDFVWHADEGHFSVEVKTEEKTTGNLFLETISNCTTGEAGWLFTSEADLVAYGFLDGPRWLLFPLLPLRECIARRPDLPTRRARTTAHDGTLYETEGVLLSLDDDDARALCVALTL